MRQARRALPRPRRHGGLTRHATRREGAGHEEAPQSGVRGDAIPRPRGSRLRGQGARRRVPRWRVPRWASRWLPSWRRLSPWVLLGWSLCRRGLRGLGVRVSVLRLSVLRVSVLPLSVLSVRLPHVCAAGLPAANAGDRGAAHPAGRLLHRGLLPSARRWSDGRLFLDLGAGRTRAAPGSAEPLGPAPARSCLGPPWWTVRRPFLVLASLNGDWLPRGVPARWVHGASRRALGVETRPEGRYRNVREVGQWQIPRTSAISCSATIGDSRRWSGVT